MNPPADVAQKLADALGVPLAYLMTTDDRLAQAILMFAKLPPAEQDSMLGLLQAAVMDQRGKPPR